MADLTITKQLLRETALATREQMSRQERTEHSERICQNLWALIQERQANTIHTFLTMGTEINVLPLVQQLLDAGKQVVAPKTMKRRQLEHRIVRSLQDMESGVFGTYHPKSENQFSGTLDLIIIPGLAFDVNGGRLGYGGGYYDTFLIQHPEAWKVGICYPNQLLPGVPLEPHDISMDQIVC